MEWSRTRIHLPKRIMFGLATLLARPSYALAQYVRDLGVRGLIALVRNTIASPWLAAEELQRIATAPCQIRLE